MRCWAAVPVALAVCTWTAACDDSTTMDTTRAAGDLRVVRGSGSVRATVDLEGARLELTENAALTIDRDSLSEAAEIELSALNMDTLEQRPPPGEALGRPFVVRPEAIPLRQPGELELPVQLPLETGVGRVRIARRDDTEGAEWEALEPARLDAGDGELRSVALPIDRGGVYVGIQLPGVDGTTPDPLSVSAGLDRSVDEQTLVSLGAVVSPSKGATLSWTQRSGPTVTLLDAQTATPSFQAPDVAEETELTFEVVAANDANETASDSVTLTVRFLNQPPSANAGPDQTVSGGASVTLVGSGSDPDGHFTSRWSQLAGPTMTLADATGLSITFTASAVDVTTSLVFALTVEDGDGGSASDTVTVTVEATGNLAPSVSAGIDQIVPEQTRVTLDGVASDSDGTVAELVWVQIGGAPEVALATVDQDSVAFDAPSITENTPLVFSLTATDDGGASASDSVLITLTPVNVAPSVEAGAPQSLTEDLSGNLVGTASDSDGNLESTLWRQLLGSPATIADASALSTTFTPPDVSEPETLVFELEVIDNEGAAARDTVSFNVLPIDQGNQPPLVNAGPNLVVGNGNVTLDQASASDPDGSVTAIAWSQIAGPPVSGWTGQTTLTPSFDVSAVTCAETLVFQLAVTDDAGATSSDTLGVLVNSDFASPIALGSRFDFEADDGGFTTDGSLWALDVPTTGPGVAHDGNRVWATNPAGHYGSNQLESLCLPSIDRAGAARITLSFYLWSAFGSGDGVRVEALDPTLGWQPITEVQPAYANTSLPGWSSRGRNDLYSFTTVRIPGSATNRPKLRLVMQSNGSNNGAGAYVDGVGVHSEDTDPDGDGLTGVEDEWLTYGTDPFAPDTDGDGSTDGEEVAAGTDPLNPTSFKGVGRLTPPVLLDFDVDDGELFAVDTAEDSGDAVLWQHGVPLSGPQVAHSPSQAWATDLAGNYGKSERALLYLPPLDLTDTTRPTLAFRLWAQGSTSDGTRVEVYDTHSNTWVGITPAFPAYDGRDALGNAAYTQVRRQNLYTLVAFPLTDYAGTTLSVRFAFRSNINLQNSGAYIDDLALFDEADDPDGDGIAGIIDERESTGSDPFVADTDGDGVDDGTESLVDSTNPLDAADHAGATWLAVPSTVDFELTDGGFTAATEIGGALTPDDLWQYGTAASGPGRGHTGNTVWATNLSGNYAADERAFLHVPPIDLRDAVDPTLSFRLWSTASTSDGVSVEIYAPETGHWLTLPVAFPDYNSTDAAGKPAFGTLARHSLYSLVALSLAPYVGEVVRVRLAFRSNVNLQNEGAYIDDFALHEESDDPDGDGLPGVRLERITYGTDPFLADSDGDGMNDGDEVGDSTDPLNPAHYNGGPQLSPGDLLDFEVDDGGLASMMPVTGMRDLRPGYLWQHGPPGGGPGIGYSGSSVWATKLDAHYNANDRALLHLPPIDLSSVSRASLSFRLWGRCSVNDGLSLQFKNAAGEWLALTPLTPAYDGKDAGGVSAFSNQGYQNGYSQVIVPLDALSGGLAHVRMLFRSNVNLQNHGFALDDLAVHDEDSADPDGDGLLGIAGEWETHGTDPLLADSDGDGFDDGAEVAASTQPLNPADDPDATPIDTASGVLDLETSHHDFATSSSLWRYGTLASGPLAGASGTRGWATNLDGNYFASAREYLYVPPVQIGASENTTFGFHLWVKTSNKDGLTLQIWDAESGWQTLPASGVAYQSTDAAGTPSYGSYNTHYVFAAASLTDYAGETVYLRFAFLSNSSLNEPGAYLDDFVLVDEDDPNADPDGDGVPGLLGEFQSLGTDPLHPDSDGDGVNDGSDAAPLDASVQ